MSAVRKKGWREISKGGLILEAGSAEQYDTGSWRSQRPVRDEQKCTHCMICWIYCPDSSILVEDGKMIGFDYKHCKGCGICAAECPTKAIEMRDENEFREKEGV
jgi:pyruvate ferredoxin oxidoreductase delta subunit